MADTRCYIWRITLARGWASTLQNFLVFNSLDPCLGFLRNAFTYLHPPPLILTTTGPAVDEVKEWGTHLSESETLSTADLQPFESVLFCSPHPRPNVRNVAVPAGNLNRRWSVSSSSSQPPTKRMKVEVDTGPLDELIPLVLDPI